VPVPHPIKAVIAARRITIRELAGPAQCNPHTLGRVINGWVQPWPALIERCAEALGEPETALFRSLPDPTGIRTKAAAS